MVKISLFSVVIYSIILRDQSLMRGSWLLFLPSYNIQMNDIRFNKDKLMFENKLDKI